MVGVFGKMAQRRWRQTGKHWGIGWLDTMSLLWSKRAEIPAAHLTSTWLVSSLISARQGGGGAQLLIILAASSGPHLFFLVRCLFWSFWFHVTMWSTPSWPWPWGRSDGFPVRTVGLEVVGILPAAHCNLISVENRQLEFIKKGFLVVKPEMFLRFWTLERQTCILTFAANIN